MIRKTQWICFFWIWIFLIMCNVLDFVYVCSVFCFETYSKRDVSVSTLFRLVIKLSRHEADLLKLSQTKLMYTLDAYTYVIFCSAEHRVRVFLVTSISPILNVERQ